MADEDTRPQATGICVLGMRRTGSNHLFNVLRNFEGLASCGELFSDLRASGAEALLPQIRAITGLPCYTEGYLPLCAYARSDPGGFLDIIAAAAARQGKRAYCFKIFEDQLSRATIESRILARPGTQLVLLVRRALDTYVSLQKAIASDQWMRFDTTRSPIRLDAVAFGQWLEQQNDWYGHWLKWGNAQGVTPTVLTYEDDVAQPVRIVLQRFARTAETLGIELRNPQRIRNGGLRRQDRNASIAGRVANWSEFRADLARLGLEQAAFGYPL